MKWGRKEEKWVRLSADSIPFLKTAFPSLWTCTNKVADTCPRSMVDWDTYGVGRGNLNSLSLPTPFSTGYSTPVFGVAVPAIWGGIGLESLFSTDFLKWLLVMLQPRILLPSSTALVHTDWLLETDSAEQFEGKIMLPVSCVIR